MNGWTHARADKSNAWILLEIRIIAFQFDSVSSRVRDYNIVDIEVTALSPTN